MDALTFAKTWEEAHGRTATLEQLGSLEDLTKEAQRRLQTEPQDIYGWLPLMCARGRYGGDALLGASNNALFPPSSRRRWHQR
jgi:hypothetical protein